jgi:CRP-like cAMP-binding protein
MEDMIMALIDSKDNYTLLKALEGQDITKYLEAKTMTIKSYSKDEIVHIDGDPCKHIEIILEGQVIIERIDESGDLMTITEFCPDDILGGNLVFSKNAFFPMTVTAKTDATLLRLQKGLMFQLCSSNPTFLLSFLEYISDHTRLLGDKLKHYVNRSIRESLTAYLKSEHLLQKSMIIYLRTSKKALADRIGVQRTSLSRELQKMKNEGLIDFDKNSITIISSVLLK